MSFLPTEAEAEREHDPEPRVVGVDTADADEVLGALSASTARDLLARLHEEPATPSELADATDTSLQNAQYHLGKLEDADLVEVCDVRYSTKGREMRVYAATDGPLVLFAGNEEEGEGIQSALSKVLSAIGVLAVISFLVQVVVDNTAQISTGTSAPVGFRSAGGLAGGGVPIGTGSGTNAALGMPAGVLFFLGGLLALAVLAGWWQVQGKYIKN
ncbi:MAG: ArsR/SmtB family transcription factor [Halobacteriaceae archaeon]